MSALAKALADRRALWTTPIAASASEDTAPPVSAASIGAPAATRAATPLAATSPTAAVAASELVGEALVLHVARRVSFGPTPALLDEIRSLGVDGWLEEQLSPSAIEDAEVEDRLAPLGDLERGPRDFRTFNRPRDEVLADLRVAAVVRAVHGRRQLQELMVDLWHDHLAASAAKGKVAWHLPAYDRASIRPHALGRFVDLLRAVTRSGAMLEYLDTAVSAAPDVNENHGRELLELHTVGRDSGMGEADVVGAARVLSGWTLDPQTLEVVFDPARHHPGPATVLGWTTPGRSGAAGGEDLDSLLQHLATHPATAITIATLLARRFIADDPPSEVVASTAAAYLEAGTDLASTLRHLFASASFRSGGSPIVRRPLDLLAAQLRGTNAALEVPNVVGRVLSPPPELEPIVDPVIAAAGAADPLVEPLAGAVLPTRPIAVSIANVLRRNGQALFAAPNPSGFAVRGSRWGFGDALLRRWTLGAVLAQDRLPGISIDVESLVDAAATAGPAVDALAVRCFGAAPAVATRTGALAAMGRGESDAVDDPQQLRKALAFLLAAPEVQVR
jgi:uncharacterized protein (DUF1800 family)